MTFKNRWRNYKSIGIFCIVFVLFLICFIIYSIFQKNKKQEVVEERINISDFSNTLEIDKEWKLLSYPEVTILSDADGQLMTLNVTEWDIVQEWDILMQIWDENWEIPDTNIDTRLWRQFAEYYQKKDEYNQFELEFWEEISNLENELRDNGAALSIAIDTQDEKNIEFLKENTENINKKLSLLDSQRDYLKSEITRLDSEILLENQENINYLYEVDKYSPRATIPWIIWNIYVHEWDEIKNGDKLCTIIDNTYSPEIAVWLDFNEYVLTQDLTWVMIITENENRWNSYYEWEIYTRSPKINEDGEYTLTVRILEEVSDLILSDKNTKITVVFTKDFPTIRIPENCFTKISNNTWNLTLRDGEVITWKEIWIKNKWDNWINIDNLTLYSLENEEKKNEMNLYANLQSKNFSSNLWWNRKNFEILCRLN